MAAKRVQEPKVEAMTRWASDTQWENLDGALSAGVWRRLAAADRSLFASNAIAEMLNRDRLGKNDARDNEDVTYRGLSELEMEALIVAMLELGSCAQTALGEVRNNAYGCCGKSETNSSQGVR